jgi:membrane-bound lytic murein transglycosylase B
MERCRGLAAAGVGVAILGLSALPTAASAEQRQVQVTLLGGKTFTITVDVPAGTPVSSIHLPGIKLPILSIVEVGAPANTPTIDLSGKTAPPQAAAPAASAPAASATATATPKHRHRARHRAARKAAAQAVHVAAAQHRSARGTAPVDAAAPTAADPSFSFAVPGAAVVGVPNFFIDKFRIPPFLLPIYQAAGIEYGVRWEILAAINEIETDYGRNLSTSTAGAVGWMQFMPATWRRYGVDANRDHARDPYNPVDAIFAAARYLKAAGAQTDIRRAIFAYNHADWYVDSVLMRARLIGGMPADLVGSLTGLTGGRFPVAAPSRYAQG